MNNIIGNHLTLTIFGESHGPVVGGVIDGMPSGVRIDMDLLDDMMNKRRAYGDISTARKEEDKPEFLSGLKDGYTEGTPLAFIIANNNTNRNDYADLAGIARPGHADYAGHVKYRGYGDASGGGHFSGRLTAVMVAAGAVCMHMLNTKGVFIGTHIDCLHDINDDPFNEDDLEKEISLINARSFPVLNADMGERMITLIKETASSGDSLGGILDTAVIGLEAGIGSPIFDSLESVLSHALFAIPAVKGIAFGAGFAFARMYGYQANDPFIMKEDKIVTATNNNGGVNGGISNGMPLRFKTVIKPTPSISRLQQTVDFIKNEEKDIEIKGRHDPAIIHRARIVVDALTAFVLADQLMDRYGSVYFGGEKQ